MFYSERLLAKTGPLARVWLASNVERKLTKQQVLQQDITTSVHTIVEQGEGPIALRLSAQLMLGVVRIYGRKARYLLDDCNDALTKIRMTFRVTNNHDLPAGQTSTTIDLNLPEQLTIDDLFPALDFSFPLTQQPNTTQDDRDMEDEDDWASSLNPYTQESSDRFVSAPSNIALNDDDLGLDLGEDVGIEDTTISMQMGRGAATPRPDEPTDLPQYEDDLGLDLGEDVGIHDTTIRADDVAMAGIEDEQLALPEDEETVVRQNAAEREETPLSEADPNFIAEADRTFQLQQESIVEEEAVAPQRQARKFKPMVPDMDTVVHNSEIKTWEQDRSKILKSSTYEDPELAALLEMQKNGDFVNKAMRDAFGSAWAPEIQGLLSFDVVMRSGKKRKRDSGIADVASEDEHSDKSPRLDRGQAEEEAQDEAVEMREPSRSPARTASVIPEDHIPIAETEEELAAAVPGEDDAGIAFGDDGGFDDTTMPLVHPADSGPISLGTQHAVHRLREVFGDYEDSPATQSRKHITLQELIPETRTSREDATKMFFETLVLATKDCIKVDQEKQKPGENLLDLPIRIRAKRGLWGEWANPSTQAESNEMEVGA